MTWTPTLKTIKARHVADNLAAYILDATRQADAYTWAGGTGQKLIKKFSASVANRTTPVYPALAYSDDNDAQDFTTDIIRAAYSVTFEVSVQNSNPDTAVTQAQVYRDAIVSMIVNVPPATLITNTGALTGAVLDSIETGFDPIKTNDAQNDFLQQFQIRVTYTLHAASR